MMDQPKNGFEAITNPIHEAMQLHGITPDYLAKKLEEELEAEETKLFAFRGEIIGERNLTDWGTRQRARIDAHKLRGDYPAEEHKLNGTMNFIPQFTPEDREMILNLSNKVVDAILNQHRRDIAST